MKISTICFPVRGADVLLSKKKRGFGVGYLNGYGGKQQDGDATVEDAAIRELQEEGGVDASTGDLEKVAVIDFFRGKEQIFECHIYFLNEWQGEFQETEEMAKPEAYPISNIPYDQMWHADRVWLPIVFSGQKIRARSYYNEDMSEQVHFEHEPLN